MARERARKRGREKERVQSKIEREARGRQMLNSGASSELHHEGITRNREKKREK